MWWWWSTLTLDTWDLPVLSTDSFLAPLPLNNLAFPADANAYAISYCIAVAGVGVLQNINIWVNLNHT